MFSFLVQCVHVCARLPPVLRVPCAGAGEEEVPPVAVTDRPAAVFASTEPVTNGEEGELTVVQQVRS